MLQKAASSNSSTGDDPMAEMLMYIPLEMDIALHAVPALALALDFFLFERKYGRKSIRFLAPFVGCAYAVCYSCWVEHCSSKNNGICTWFLRPGLVVVLIFILFWVFFFPKVPYPFLTDNTFNARLWIYAGAGSIAPLSFWVLNSLHTWIFEGMCVLLIANYGPW